MCPQTQTPASRQQNLQDVFDILPSIVNTKRGPATSGAEQMPYIPSHLQAVDSLEDIRAEYPILDLSVSENKWVRFVDDRHKRDNINP